jgi:formylglycine-generating enzyme required for sulfatase activity
MKTSPSAFWIAALILCTSIASAQVWPYVDVDLEMSTDGVNWGAITPGLITVNASEAHFRTVLTPVGGGSLVAGEPVSEHFPTGNGTVQVSLDRSDDLTTWAAISPGAEAVDPKAFLRVETDAAMSLIPAGVFMMGSDPAEPGRDTDETQHEVTLTRSIYVQQTEVTKAQWDEVRAQGPALGYTDLSQGGELINYPSVRHPVVSVTWHNVVKWLNLLSELDGLTPCYTNGGLVIRTGLSTPDCDFDASGYRLPTEAEWEYACRAGTATAFYNGPITYTDFTPLDPNLDAIGWYGGNEGSVTHSVGEKASNLWGLYDTSGNILEWCWDWYSSYGEGAPVTDPVGELTGPGRILRGGAFLAKAFECRSAFRNYYNPAEALNFIGFRPVRTDVP